MREEMKKNLNEFHEKVDILSVEFSREILNSFVKHGSQWIHISTNRKSGFPKTFNVISRTSATTTTRHCEQNSQNLQARERERKREPSSGEKTE